MDQEIKEGLKDLNERVTRLEYNEIRRDDKIVALCEKMDQVLNVGKWLIGVFSTAFITGFFSLAIYIVETHIR